MGAGSNKDADMSCRQLQEQIYAFLDGALPSPRRARVQRHIASCSACRMQAASIRRIEDQFRTALRTDQPMPPGLWARMHSGLIADAGPPTEGVGLRLSRPWIMWPALLFALVATTAAIVGFTRFSKDSQARLIEVPVHELQTFVDSHRAFDVVTQDPATLRGWFLDKVDFAPPLPAPVAGLELVGGRLCYLLERRVVSYMYRADERFVSLYIMEVDDLNPPPGEAARVGGRQVAVLTVGDYTNVIWQDGGLLYSLVAALPQERLLEINRAFSFHGPLTGEEITPVSDREDPWVMPPRRVAQ